MVGGPFAFSVAIVVGVALAVGFTASRSPANVGRQVNQPQHFLEIESGGTVKMAKLRALRTTVLDERGQPQWFMIGACVAVAGSVRGWSVFASAG